MISFVALGALLTVIALGFVLWPFRRGMTTTHAADRQAENVAIYRQRVDELRAEQAAGRVAPEDLEGLVDELSAALLDDVPDGAGAGADEAPVARSSRLRAPLVLAVLVPVAVLALYLRLGAGPDFQLAGAADLLRSPIDQPAALAELVARLERHVRDRPDDADSLFLLGHARMRERNFDAAAASFARVIALKGSDANTVVSLIQAKFLADGGRMSEENRKQAEALLVEVPHQPLVLEMLAIDATSAGNPERAVGYLERAVTGAASPTQAAALGEELARARQLAGLGPGPSIDVTVEGLDKVAQTGPDSVLYVLARRQGERMPRMVTRRSVGGAGRIEVHLDGTSIMGDQVPLRSGEILEVVARFSPSGDVRSGPGTLEAVSEPITLADQPVPIALTLAAPSGAAEPASAPVRPRTLAPDGARVTVQLTATPELDAPPDARVFIIVRPLSGPPMPIAVRALTFAELPVTVELSDRDAMQPGRTISGFEEVAVLARLSRSGAPVRQPGDAESEIVRVQPADRPAVSLVLR